MFFKLDILTSMTTEEREYLERLRHFDNVGLAQLADHKEREGETKKAFLIRELMQRNQREALMQK